VRHAQEAAEGDLHTSGVSTEEQSQSASAHRAIKR
jgi:hypothetical protein